MTDEAASGPVTAEGAVSAWIRNADNGVSLTVTWNGTRVLDEVPLGFVAGGTEFGADSELVRVAEHTVRDRFRAHSGKAVGEHGYEHREVVHAFREAGGAEWQVIMRVARDGVAIRYALPALDGTVRVTGDRTAVTLPAGSRSWVLDYQTWYETPRYGAGTAELSAGAYGLPLLTRLDAERHVLITESAIDGRFAGAHLRAGEPDADGGRTLRFTFADDAVEVARGPVTPWRVFLVGTLPRLVSSLLVEELAPPASPELEEAAWVRPGRAAWSWWSDFYSGAQLEKQKHFVDVAAGLGWEHLLIDCGWDETWVPEIVAYAGRRGVQVHLWAVWRDLNGPEALRKLALWRSWGVAGIKVDFMESESKDRYRWYDTILTETARLGLMVNFHGSVIPRGWARTWPQVIGYEAIRGAEYYVFFENQALTAAHNVIQPFTRNIAGAMDATPVAFGAGNRTTSDGHELGLSVAFECGITHFAGHVDAYTARPPAARFLAELAPYWEETVLLSGDPDSHAVVARRYGDRWFVGGIATGPARTVHVPFAELGVGPAAQVWIVGDASPAGDEVPATGLAETTTTAGHGVDVEVARDGGFVAIVAPADADLFRSAARPVRPAPAVRPAVAEVGPDGVASLTTDADARLRLPPGWTARRAGDTGWAVRPAPSLPPGHLGVVTVERDGDGVVPVIAHARVVRPLEPGSHALSGLPMLAFVNDDGPVERDQSNGGGNPGDGRPLRVAGQGFDRGLGTAPYSEARFHLGGHATTFTGAVGVDDESAGRAAVAVLADDREIFTAVVEAGKPVTVFHLDVRGAQTLCLRSESATPADTGVHVDWVDTTLHVTPPIR
ncbi:glycoside hydrolase family 97 catalytic domain-containing protein [Microbispora sp. RL4-1S]|uniref:Glycoside hydrolase family 97 catalytic domain-containing protein n=1 Tax=Microbispora oryzae TaxID=2806554 RepID=A0A941AKC1_9ACTN|nr:glycoside hydrolase family 97 catalytic domain-containing protein [Microbispora oryzae]MBP2705927.1 glycoside hydrolase family 97 catalytic domain-containing protein [Microbispora oryzae]